MSEKIESLSIRETVYQKVRWKILKGELKRGEKLIEAELAESLGVSRTPVREALHKLEQEGLVEIFPRRYCEVKGITPKCIEEINLIRSLLEPAAAKKATNTLTDEQLVYLEELLNLSELHFADRNVEKLMEVHDEFHQCIIRASGYDRVIQILENMHDYIIRFRYSFLAKSHLVERSIKEHRDILNALKERDPEKVEENYRKHLSGISEYELVVLEEDPVKSQ
jgi:DNA-binding GntR family transcriptional regulator